MMKHNKTTRRAIAVAALLLGGALLHALLTSGTVQAEDNARPTPKNIFAGEIVAKNIVVSETVFAKQFVLLNKDNKVCGRFDTNDGLPMLSLSGPTGKEHVIAISITEQGPLVTVQRENSVKVMISVLKSGPLLVMMNPAGKAALGTTDSGPQLLLKNPNGYALLSASAILTHTKTSNAEE